MNQNDKEYIPDDEVAHLAREIGLPLPDGFKERVFNQIREREFEQKKKVERDREKKRNRDRGIDR